MKMAVVREEAVDGTNLSHTVMSSNNLHRRERQHPCHQLIISLAIQGFFGEIYTAPTKVSPCPDSSQRLTILLLVKERSQYRYHTVLRCKIASD